MSQTATPQAPAAGDKQPDATRSRAPGAGWREYGILGALVAIVLLFQVLTGGRLLRPDNVASLLQQNAYVMILAIGMLMVIVAGHIDLSVGSIVAFIGGVLAIAMRHWNRPWPLAILLALALGGLIGAWQGFWVAFVGIPAFIVTLAGMLIFRGLAIIIVGETIAGLPSGFVRISNGGATGWFGFAGVLDVFTLVLGAVAIAGLVFSQLRARRALASHDLVTESAGIFWGKIVVIGAIIAYFTWVLSRSALGTPFVLLLCATLILAYGFVMGRTVFGRHIYAIGGNVAAARLSGVNVVKTNFWIFVNMGVLAALASVVTTSRAGAAVAAAGQNFELDAIAACFIGGTAVTGGVGRVTGAIIGALIMGTLNMGLSIMSVDPAWQQAIKGLVLLGAVAFDLINKRKAAGS